MPSIGTASSTGNFEGMQGMEGLENTTVTAIDQLATLYAQPSERVLRKEIDHVDAVGRAFIAASPFLILATGSSEGLDCSPKGDKPGFVQVDDDGRTLLIPDRRGNVESDSGRQVGAITIETTASV